MREPAAIIVEVSSNYPKLFQGIQKYADYINYLMDEQTFSQFYLEIVSDGLLYIYKDWATFQMINRPYRDFQLRQFQKRFKETIEPDLLLGQSLTADTFPTNGITLFFKTSCTNKDQVLQTGELHFRSFFEEGVEIGHDAEGDISVRFKEFEALSKYTFLISSMLSGLIQVKATGTKKKEPLMKVETTIKKK